MTPHVLILVNHTDQSLYDLHVIQVNMHDRMTAFTSVTCIYTMILSCRSARDNTCCTETISVQMSLLVLLLLMLLLLLLLLCGASRPVSGLRLQCCGGTGTQSCLLWPER